LWNIFFSEFGSSDKNVYSDFYACHLCFIHQQRTKSIRNVKNVTSLLSPEDEQPRTVANLRFYGHKQRNLCLYVGFRTKQKLLTFENKQRLSCDVYRLKVNRPNTKMHWVIILWSIQHTSEQSRTCIAYVHSR